MIIIGDVVAGGGWEDGRRMEVITIGDVVGGGVGG